MSNSAKKSSPNRSKAPQPIVAASERKPALSIIRDIQRQTRRQYTAEEKIRIVLEGLQGEQSVDEKGSTPISISVEQRVFGSR